MVTLIAEDQVTRAWAARIRGWWLRYRGDQLRCPRLYARPGEWDSRHWAVCCLLPGHAGYCRYINDCGDLVAVGLDLREVP